MGRVWVGIRVAGLALLMGAVPAAARAAQSVAIFPFDMVLQKTEEDFYFGPKGPSEDEQRRLELAHAELVRLVEADGRYEVMDLKGLKKEIEEAAPIFQCNGCELDIAKKVNAELSMTSVIDKISETHLSLTIALVDVSKSSLLSSSSVLIQGNTDEAWSHGVRWLARNRLFAAGKTQ